MKSLIKNAIKRFKEIIIYDNTRRDILFAGVNVVLSLVSFGMSVVNLFTHEYSLMLSTLIFAFACILNIVFIHIKWIPKKLIYAIFAIEALVLLSFFLISGIPDGFSVLWFCLIPSFALLIFGRKGGSLFCVITLAVLIFIFRTSVGQGVLLYAYSDTFMLRFPLLYSATFLISLMVEFVRSETQNQLLETEKKYRFLYRHDALTGLYNRYGFNEIIDSVFSEKRPRNAAILILDIDDFKRVNDKYGHVAGDEVLKKIAGVPGASLCEHCRYCRWGGEEFMVLMQCEHNPVATAEKIRRAIEEAGINYHGNRVSVTVSIGVCTARDISLVTAEQMITRADQCLYESKKNGKNRVTAAELN